MRRRPRVLARDLRGVALGKRAWSGARRAAPPGRARRAAARAAPRTRAPRRSGRCRSPRSESGSPTTTHSTSRVADERGERADPGPVAARAPARAASPRSRVGSQSADAAARTAVVQREDTHRRQLSAEAALERRPRGIERLVDPADLAPACPRQRGAPAAAAAEHARPRPWRSRPASHAALDERRARRSRPRVRARRPRQRGRSRRRRRACPLTRSATSGSALASSTSTVARARPAHPPTSSAEPRQRSHVDRRLGAPPRAPPSRARAARPRARAATAPTASSGVVRRTRRDLLQRDASAAQRRDRGRPAERLDAPHVGGARGLAEDPHDADLGGRAHVRAAAQLAREIAVADLDHPHDLAVLLAEQRHRAERPGLVERRA